MQRTRGAPLVGILLLMTSCDAPERPQALRASATPEPTPSPIPTPSPSPIPTPTPVPDPWELARRMEAPDAATLAARLADALEDVRAGRELEAAGRTEQAAYRGLVVNPEWMDEVLSRLPAADRAGVRANVEAGGELRRLTPPRDVLPQWRIVAPAPAADLLRFYKDAAAAHRVGWTYLAAINLVETRMGRIRGLSSAGARGPMQFMPPTWARYGQGNIEDPRDSIMAAARYLSANGGRTDIAKALFAYNRDRRYVRGVSLYAERMQADERTFGAYYHWQVYVRTTRGDALLPEGWIA